MADPGKRTIPCDKGAEQAFLGALLIDPKSVSNGLALVRKDDFYSSRNQIVFNAIYALDAKHVELDMVTLTGNLEENGLLSDAGGIEYLDHLQNQTPTSRNLEHYAKIIRDKATQRRLLDAADRIKEIACLPDASIEEISDQAEGALFSITERNLSRTDEEMKKIVVRTFTLIQNMKSGKLTGLKTGFTDFDEMTSGLQGGQLVVIAARPGIGKTSFALNLAMNASKISDKPIIIFSLEMQKEELCMRMLCSESRVENYKLKHGLIGQKDVSRLSQTAQLLYNSNMIIDDKPNITVTEVRSKARRIKNEKGDLGLIILDYIQLVDGPPDIKRDNRYVIISEVSRGLKYLAKELNVPVIALSQLSRKIEERTDRRPMLSDLRESGQIEQDADIVAFIHRNFQYSQNEEEKNEAELIIGKHRGGAQGTIKLHFTGDYTRFDNASSRKEA